LADDPRPDCACGEREAAGDPRAPPTARWAGCDGLPKVAGACDDPPSKLGVMLFSGTSHDRSISSPSLALTLLECFAPFSGLPFRRRRSNASTSLSALVSTKSSSTMSSRSSSNARGYGHRGKSSRKDTSPRRAGVSMWGAGKNGQRRVMGWQGRTQFELL